MKNLIIILIASLGFMAQNKTVNAQDFVLVKDSVSVPEDNAQEFKKLSGNFAKAVDTKLKEMYPATFESPDVFLYKGNGDTLKVVYQILIRRCEEQYAFYHFNSGIAMYWSPEFKNAIKDAEKGAMKGGDIALNNLKEKASGQPNQATMLRKSFAKDNNGDFICIANNFVALGK